MYRAVYTISRFQDSEGGYGGGPYQLPHLASTYAAVMALMIVSTKEALELTDRKKLYSFLMRLKQPDGSFVMHEDGEVDVRGSFCALSVALVFNLLTPELCENAAQFIAKCQTYEGGLGGVPNSEAHGGYTFCGVAALAILGQTDAIDGARLLKWLVNRQMKVEKGFQGRTNKLVDGCYGFWQAGIFQLLSSEIQDAFDKEGLCSYQLSFSQQDTGGFADRIEHRSDYYHTCYCLSGLSSVSHKVSVDSKTKLAEQVNLVDLDNEVSKKLQAVHPFLNISVEKANKAITYFIQK
jgi:protein farnesyltransferase subunit beta